MIVVPITHCLQCERVGTTSWAKEYTDDEINEIRAEQLANGYKLTVMPLDEYRAYKATSPSYCYCNCGM